MRTWREMREREREREREYGKYQGKRENYMIYNGYTYETNFIS